jgi:hypothetical protein
MDNTEPRAVDYKTHILIGVRADGVMKVICDWPHVPTQADVQEEMNAARDGYVACALCTPTSIIPVDDDASGDAKGRSRFGRLG